MLLTRAADYAIRVLIHMAGTNAGPVQSLARLADATGAPASFLSKVLQSLVRAGMISSRRGNDGGFEILAAGRRATVRDVIEVIDGPLELNVCLSSGRSCERKSHCGAHRVWVEAQEAMMGVLDKSTMASLARSSSDRPGL